MARKGIIPFVLSDTFSTAAATKWGEDCTKDVGFVKITAAHAVTFDAAVVGEPGDTVVVFNDHSGNVNVIITPEPLSDSDADTITMVSKSYVTVMFHPDNGWLILGATDNSGVA